MKRFLRSTMLFVLASSTVVSPLTADPTPVVTCEATQLQLDAILIGAQQISADVENPTGSQQLGKLGVNATMNGQALYFEVGLDLEANSEVTVTITFPSPTQTNGVVVCGWGGGSIIDAPDPIEVRVDPKEDPDSGNGDDPLL